VKILHIVYQSLPNISGSSIRTRDIVLSQKSIGLIPVVISSPFQNGLSNNSKIDFINNIKHYRTYNNSPGLLVKEDKTPLYKRILKVFMIFGFYYKTKTVIKEEKPDIIHAHATFFCAIVAIILGKFYKIPVCYEVRSLWEEREKKTANTFVKRLQPRIISSIETFCMRKADKVIVINERLKNDLLKRKVKNISIVPNAVNIERIRSQPYEFNGRLNFGYIGSVSSIEGLDLIAKVWAKLEKSNISNQFHVYGDGNYFSNLKALVGMLGLKHFILHGEVSSERIDEAFGNVDVIVNPRLKSKISDTVTPLKPLEAMAYKKLVIASDVGGMKELITHNYNGLLFSSDSVESLENVVRGVLVNGIDKNILERSLKYIKEEKSWIVNAELYKGIYTKLVG